MENKKEVNSLISFFLNLLELLSEVIVIIIIFTPLGMIIEYFLTETSILLLLFGIIALFFEIFVLYWSHRLSNLAPTDFY